MPTKPAAAAPFAGCYGLSMVRAFLLPALLSGILLVFWLWAVVDALLTDSRLIRHLQKSMWILLIVFVPTFGAALWVFFGRPEGGSMVPGGAMTSDDNPRRSARRPLGLEDTPGWTKRRSIPSTPASTSDAESLAIRERKLMEYEAELAKRERELEARERAAADNRSGNDEDELSDEQPEGR